MTKKRRKNLKAPEGLDAVLARAGENRFAKTSLAVPPRVWNEAVGLKVAERARPETLERGILTVRVATSVWAHELSLLAPTILERLRSHGVAARELRFKTAPIDAPLRVSERRVDKVVPPPAPVPTSIASTIARIEDPDLRRELERAVRSNLAWQSNRADGAPVSGGPPTSRVPRDAGKGSAPPARTKEASGEGPPRTPGDDRGRRR